MESPFRKGHSHGGESEPTRGRGSAIASFPPVRLFLSAFSWLHGAAVAMSDGLQMEAALERIRRYSLARALESVQPGSAASLRLATNQDSPTSE